MSCNQGSLQKSLTSTVEYNFVMLDERMSNNLFLGRSVLLTQYDKILNLKHENYKEYRGVFYERKIMDGEGFV